MVQCQYPIEDKEDPRPLREDFDEWRTSEQCSHSYCEDAAYYGRLYRAGPKPLTREEKEEIESDTGFMREHMHGRDLDGNIR